MAERTGSFRSSRFDAITLNLSVKSFICTTIGDLTEFYFLTFALIIAYDKIKQGNKKMSNEENESIGISNAKDNCFISEINKALNMNFTMISDIEKIVSELQDSVIGASNSAAGCGESSERTLCSFDLTVAKLKENNNSLIKLRDTVTDLKKALIG